MRFLRNLKDQVLDGASKRRVQAECQMIRQSWDDEGDPIGSEEDFSSAHDILIEELSRVGTATEDYREFEDFILNRHAGDRSWIGIVCERYSARVILAVRAAQARFSEPFPIVLDCDGASVTVTFDGRVYGDNRTNDKSGEKILRSFGFTG